MSSQRMRTYQVSVLFLSVVAGLWTATQWTAWRLRYQPALSGAWLHLSLPQKEGVIVYPPWQLFAWWYDFDVYAHPLFARAGLAALASGLLGVGCAGLGALFQNSKRRAATTYGSARWAELPEIRAAGLTRNTGVFLGRLGPCFLRHDGPEHVLAFAPTRSGKGVGLVVPTLLTWQGSVIVHDIKGENWRLTAGYRSRMSHCLCFNPTDAKSAHYNPLLEVRKGPNEVRDAQNIADILVDPEGALERRNHWEKTSYSLLVGLILHVLYAEPEKTLRRVASLLSDPRGPIEDALNLMLTTNHLGTKDQVKVHPVVASAARELLNKAPNERSGIVSSTQSFLSLYNDPVVSSITASCDWRISDLMSAKYPVSLFLVIPPSDISRTRPLIRLILNQVGRRLTEHLDPLFDHKTTKKAGHHGLLFMLDEFPALGRLDFFETALAFLAGYGIRAFLIAQSLNQISKVYGESNAILDNCHVRIAFSANDERTARRISEALGTSTTERAQRNYAGHRLATWLPHVSVSSQESARPLLTPGEVMQLPPDEALVLVSGLPPIRARKLRYFEENVLKARCLPPPQLCSEGYTDKPRARPCDWMTRNEGNTTELQDTSVRPGHAEVQVSKGAPTAGEDSERVVAGDNGLPICITLEIASSEINGQSERPHAGLPDIDMSSFDEIKRDLDLAAARAINPASSHT